MSRTVRDVVDALRVDEERLFDPDAVWQGSLRRARRHANRRRTAIALGVGIAAVVTVTAPAMVLTAWSPGSDPVLPGGSAGVTGAPSIVATPTPVPTTPPPSMPSTRAPLSETLREVSEGGWNILPTETSARHQRANVHRDVDSTLVASVDVYEPGVFDPSPVLDGMRTTVDGASAYYAWAPNPSSMTGDPQRTLAWEYAPDAWAVARMEPEPSAPIATEIPGELLEIASLVELGEPEAILLPFRVGDRPDSLVPHSVRHFSAAYPDRTVYYEYIDEPVDFWDPMRDLKLPLRINMRPAEPDEWRPNTTIAGQPAMHVGNSVIVAIDDVWVSIGTGVVNPPSIEQIEQVFAGMTFADWNDQSTWFDANSAA